MSKKESAQEQTDGLRAREEALAARETQLEDDLKQFNIIRNRLKDFEATAVASGAKINLSEIRQDHSIEMVTDHDPKLAIDLELFMNEMITIYVYPDGRNGSLDCITPTVNGINQPIIRGMQQTVKRKYVEALARSRTTDYQQELADPQRPESIQMRPIASLTYPFVVREDRNPRGKDWLDRILAQPM